MNTGGVAGKEALLSNIDAAISLAEQIKSTYGPNGRDKLICSKDGNITITNDGATLLKLLEPKHPISQLLVKLSRTQDDEIGDGTTGVVLLAAALLKEARDLINLGYHVQTIIQGYKKALNLAIKHLDEIKQPLPDDENLRNHILNKIIQVPLNSKLLSHDREFFTKIIVQAVNKLKHSDQDCIQILPIQGGSFSDSYLIDGIVFKRTFSYAGFEQQQKRIKNAKILLLNHEIELKHQKEFAHLNISGPSQYKSFVDAEWNLVTRKLDQIYATNCDLVLNVQPIGDLATQHFVQNNITNLSRIPLQLMTTIKQTVGGTIYSTLEHLNEKKCHLGFCSLFQNVTIGDDRYCILSGCDDSSKMTLILRGPSEELLSEAHRSVHDAICIMSTVMSNPFYIIGGGATEMSVNSRINHYVNNQDVTSERSHSVHSCMKAFGRALQHIVITLCENAGMNIAEVFGELESIHQDHNQNWFYGVDVLNGCAGDLKQNSVYEPVNVKKNALMCACEAACLILSIDYVVKMPQEETEKEKGARVAKQYQEQKIAQNKWKREVMSQRKELA
ncbi:TCP-1 chaperonin, eta subunit [Acrasis kona]|uniref:CCT-eta n=1 Tax=Acrasis kona TaxID=1008807 RepID=A0AAW2ZL99_9EUKA